MEGPHSLQRCRGFCCQGPFSAWRPLYRRGGVERWGCLAWFYLLFISAWVPPMLAE